MDINYTVKWLSSMPDGGEYTQSLAVLMEANREIISCLQQG